MGGLPCKRFSPTLVSAYELLKRAARDRFEWVFISGDHDNAEQLAHVRASGLCCVENVVVIGARAPDAAQFGACSLRVSSWEK